MLNCGQGLIISQKPQLKKAGLELLEGHSQAGCLIWPPPGALERRARQEGGKGHGKVREAEAAPPRPPGPPCLMFSTVRPPWRGQIRVIYLQLEMCGWTLENSAALNVAGFCLSVHVG